MTPCALGLDDLVERIRRGASLNAPDPATSYGDGCLARVA